MGAADLDLTFYQKQFVELSVALNVSSIVIGGKARAFHGCGPSTDLDLWMLADNSPESAVHLCLLRWSEMYPLHTAVQILEPFTILPTHMRRFPEDDVRVFTDDGSIETIVCGEGIDILFGLPGFDFEAAYTRAERWQSGGSRMRVLSMDLLGPTAALKKKAL